MLYRNEKRCLQKNEIAILRTKNTTIRATCGIKLIEEIVKNLWNRLV